MEGRGVYPNTPDSLQTLWWENCEPGGAAPHPVSLSSTPLCALQVKQIMEEAVTRKFVHEDSSHIISFCGELVTASAEAMRSSFLAGLQQRRRTCEAALASCWAL